MTNLIIKKWIQPYLLLESLKNFYDIQELIFDGSSKNICKAQMYSAVDSGNIGLYMKNVNKFYILKNNNDCILKDMIAEYLSLCADDFLEDDDREHAISLVDLGKSEASFIF